MGQKESDVTEWLSTAQEVGFSLTEMKSGGDSSVQRQVRTPPASRALTSTQTAVTLVITSDGSSIHSLIGERGVSHYIE